MKLVEGALLGDTNDALKSKSISDLNLEKPSSRSTSESLVSSKAPTFVHCAVFQQKLFGSSFAQTQLVITESTVTAINPLPPGTSTSNSTPMDIPLIVADVADPDATLDVPPKTYNMDCILPALLVLYYICQCMCIFDEMVVFYSDPFI